MLKFHKIKIPRRISTCSTLFVPFLFIAVGLSAQSRIRPSQVNPSQRAPSISASQTYLMVTDVLDGFGGATESDNYRIVRSSGGEPSAVGVSQSDYFVVKSGFVNASYVMHGDANANGVVDMGDAIYLLNYLFRSGSDPCPMEAGDVNCNGLVDLGDAIFLLNYLFRGGPPPPC